MGEYPIPGLDGGGGIPSHVWTGGYSILGLDEGGVHHPMSGWWGSTQGTPWPGLDGGGYPSQVWIVGGTWGTPHHDWMGYPLPTMTGWGTLQAPPGHPPPPLTPPQYSEHLLRGGRYASCVHAVLRTFLFLNVFPYFIRQVFSFKLFLFSCLQTFEFLLQFEELIKRHVFRLVVDNLGS